MLTFYVLKYHDGARNAFKRCGDQTTGHNPNITTPDFGPCSMNAVAVFLLAVEEGMFLGTNGWYVYMHTCTFLASMTLSTLSTTTTIPITPGREGGQQQQ